MMCFALWKPKTTIFTVLLPLVAKVTVFTMFLASGRAKTLVFTQFSACCKMSFLLVENGKTLYFYDVFASRAQKKESKNGSKTDMLGLSPASLTQLDPSWS